MPPVVDSPSCYISNGPTAEPNSSITHWSTLESIHSTNHITAVFEASTKNEEGTTSYTLNEDNYENKHTFTSSKVAVDAVLTGVDVLLAGEVDKVYALVRPPGHHSHRDLVSGFCFFNNVAIAADKFVKAGKRVMIVDWDIH